MDNETREYVIVASDLDGTLLTPRHQLSEFTKNALVKLHERGLLFVFATGRHHVDVEGIREQIGIPAYMVTSNGARVHDQENNLLSATNIDAGLIEPIIRLIQKDPEIGINLFKDDEWLLSQEDDGMKTFHKESGFHYHLFDADQAPTGGIAKIFFMHEEHEYLVQFEDEINAHFGEHVHVSFSAPFCLEVMASAVSKGAALKAVADARGVSLDQCIAFGDGMNDVELLTMAGKGLLMGSAHPKVFDALPQIEVIGTNRDDAVARYLLDHLVD